MFELLSYKNILLFVMATTFDNKMDIVDKTSKINLCHI